MPLTAHTVCVITILVFTGLSERGICITGSKIDPRLSATIFSPNFTLANTDSTFSELKWLPQLYEDYASNKQTLYEGPVKQTPYNLHVRNTGGVAVTTIDKDCDIFSSVLKPAPCKQMAEGEVFSDVADLMDLLESAAAQNVPGGEVMPNMTVSRQTLASSSSYVSDSDQSDVVSECNGKLETTLNTYSDINLLLSQFEQPSDSLSLLETSTTVTNAGCHGINQMLTQDEMWNVPHSSSDSPSPATVWMESQLDLNDRALAEMGKHPSSPDRDASGPAMKRARLSSEDSTSSVNESLQRRREKNNEACRKARLNKRQKEADLRAKAAQLEEDNAKLRRKIASLEKKVKEEKDKFLQVIKP